MPLSLINKPLSMEINFEDYKVFLDNKYTNKRYARAQLNYALKYHEYLTNPSKFLALSQSQRRNILKATVCLSKYLGCYEEYKAKLKSYGIKWSNEDTAFKGFLSIFNHKHDTLPDYVKEIQPYLNADEKVLVRFLAVTGLRKGEGIDAFNMIINLNAEGKLGEYYNKDMKVLEHFKHGKVFLRGTKNTYISFVSQDLINQICECQPVTYNAIHCRFMRQGIKLRLKELRSYNNTYLRKNNIISELVDVLAGRVPKSVFCRHYLAENMKTFSDQVLAIQKSLENTLYNFSKT
jgi:intergrase/recombinase